MTTAPPLPDQATTPDGAARFAADELAHRSFRRCWRHFRSELGDSLDAVMDTIVRDADSPHEPVFWVMHERPGATDLVIASGWTGARDQVYGPLYDRTRMADATLPLQLSATWWCFHHVLVDFANLDGTTSPMECAVLVRTDAEADGVTGEMAWVLGGAPSPPTARVVDRYRLVHALGEALSAADVDAVLALIREDVEGVVRDPLAAGADPPRAIRGRQQMRQAYEDLLRDAEIVEVVPQQWHVADPRYVLMDARWTLRLRASDQVVHTRTAELLPLGPDGRIAARLGWAAPLTPAEVAR